MLTAAILVQTSAVILSPKGGASDRFVLPENLGERVWEFVQAMVKFPLFGDLSNRDGWAVLAVVALGSVAFLVVQGRVALRGPQRDWLAVAWFVSLASTVASRRMAGGERYQLMASALLALLLLALAVDRRQPMIWRRASAVLLALGIVTQAILWPGRMAGSRIGRAGATRSGPGGQASGTISASIRSGAMRPGR